MTIGNFLFSMFLNYNSVSMRSSSESLVSMRLLFVFASSVLLSLILKGLLLRYSAFDNRFCWEFGIECRTLQQSPWNYRNWYRFFSSRFQDSKIHLTTKCNEAGFTFPASVYWCTSEANHSPEDSIMRLSKSLFRTILGACKYLMHPPGIKASSVFICFNNFLTSSTMWASKVSQANKISKQALCTSCNLRMIPQHIDFQIFCSVLLLHTQQVSVNCNYTIWWKVCFHGQPSHMHNILDQLSRKVGGVLLCYCCSSLHRKVVPFHEFCQPLLATNSALNSSLSPHFLS